MSNEVIKKRFESAVNYIKNPAPEEKNKEQGNEQKLKFYALFKQSTEGPCTGKAPSKLKIAERYKYDFWKQLGSMSKEEAMKKYIEEVQNAFTHFQPTPKL